MQHIFQTDQLRRFVRTTLQVVLGGYGWCLLVMVGFGWLWGCIIRWLRVVSSGYEWLLAMGD